MTTRSATALYVWSAPQDVPLWEAVGVSRAEAPGIRRGQRYAGDLISLGACIDIRSPVAILQAQLQLHGRGTAPSRSHLTE